LWLFAFLASISHAVTVDVARFFFVLAATGTCHGFRIHRETKRTWAETFPTSVLLYFPHFVKLKISLSCQLATNQGSMLSEERERMVKGHNRVLAMCTTLTTLMLDANYITKEQFLSTDPMLAVEILAVLGDPGKLTRMLQTLCKARGKPLTRDFVKKVRSATRQWLHVVQGGLTPDTQAKFGPRLQMIPAQLALLKGQVPRPCATARTGSSFSPYVRGSGVMVPDPRMNNPRSSCRTEVGTTNGTHFEVAFLEETTIQSI